MADEACLLSLANGARDDLAAIAGEVEGLKSFEASLLEFMAPDVAEVSLAPPGPDGVALTSGAIEGVPDGFYSDLLAFEYAQSVTGVLVLVVLALMLGAQLFQSFAHMWRS